MAASSADYNTPPSTAAADSHYEAFFGDGSITTPSQTAPEGNVSDAQAPPSPQNVVVQ